jgi:hypothetical protein
LLAVEVVDIFSSNFWIISSGLIFSNSVKNVLIPSRVLVDKLASVQSWKKLIIPLEISSLELAI